MVIDEKLDEGYIIGCGCGSYFLVPRLGVSVECPQCGHTELPGGMLTIWTLERGKECLYASAAD